jgi:hypothetical protein
MSPKNILIVCWEFPPYHTIGGRRWAKITKSLVRMGYAVSVIRQNYSGAEQKSWIGAQELSKIKTYTCSSHPLVKWLHDYASPFRALKIRLAKIILSHFYKGTIYDKALGIENKFLTLAGKVIRENKIDTLFVTGAPFNLVYYTAKLKTIFPHLHVIADYRDPWIHAQNYGMKGLSPARKQCELKKQNYVFEQVDLITAPNNFLLQEIRDSYTGRATQLAKFMELPHAFDPDDAQKAGEEKTPSAKISILYGGTLYVDIDQSLVLLNDAVSHYKKEHAPQSLEIVFYTNDLSKQVLFSANADCVSFSEMIGDKIFDEIRSADFILIILAEHNKNYTTSKFYEFMPHKRPYLYVGPAGFVSEKIEKENLGYCIFKPADLSTLLDAYRSNKRQALPDTHKYTFDAITRNFIQSLSEISEEKK